MRPIPWANGIWKLLAELSVTGFPIKYPYKYHLKTIHVLVEAGLRDHEHENKRSNPLTLFDLLFLFALSSGHIFYLIFSYDRETKMQ